MRRNGEESEDVMAYANQALKRCVVCMAGIKGYAETLLEIDYEPTNGVKEYLQNIWNSAETVLAHLCADLDPDQLKGLIRYAEGHEIEILPRYSPQAQTEFYSVEKEAFDRLLTDVITDCGFCMKEGKEIKKCQRRRDLLKCGVIKGQMQGDCPYKE